MDYGPFAWVEQFSPDFSPWEGGGAHFGFLNQPNAGLANLKSLVEALGPVLDKQPTEVWKELAVSYKAEVKRSLQEVWRHKLGLHSWSEQASSVLQELLALMAASKADYTIVWRQLSEYPTQRPASADQPPIALLLRAFPESRVSPEQAAEWTGWLSKWLQLIEQQGDPHEAAVMMKLASPKFVPRSSVLAEAVTAAETGDYQAAQQLQMLFSLPYDEWPEYEELYYFRPSPSVLIN